jgi:hypothetical protein
MEESLAATANEARALAPPGGAGGAWSAGRRGGRATESVQRDSTNCPSLAAFFARLIGQERLF